MREKMFVDGLLTFSYGEEFEITLSKGIQGNVIFLTYSNKAKSEERYFYQNKHEEWMSEHQKIYKNNEKIHIHICLSYYG